LIGVSNVGGEHTSGTAGEKQKGGNEGEIARVLLLEVHQDLRGSRQ